MDNHKVTNMQHTPNTLSNQETTNSQLKYFDISLNRLLMMNIATLGLYSFYWFYRNFKLLKRPAQSNIVPFLKAFFSVFFVYSLFTKIADGFKEYPDHEKRNALMQAKVCASMYVLIGIVNFFLVLLDHPRNSVVLGINGVQLSILFSIQRMVLLYCARLTPNYKPIQSFTTTEVILISIGVGLLLLFVFIGVMAVLQASKAA